MALSREEQELREHFAYEYLCAQAPVMLDLERAVCGCDYGGTSWTTLEEAGDIGRLLGLDKDTRLLEVGAGSGWPALYLAEEFGCHATLTDVPEEALHIAADRAARQSFAGRVTLAVSDGAELPFREAHFDAVSHSDVLCCLAPKRGVLNECRRVIRRGGTMVFTVISIAPGLCEADYARAVEAGPPYLEAECEYPDLLAQTGWKIIDQIDVSAAYGSTGRRHIREVQARADAIRDLIGEAEFEDMLVRRHRNVKAVEEGIVRRDLFVTRPDAGF